MIIWTILLCFLFQASAWAQLPGKVMEMKDSLMHEMQTLQELIPGKHPVNQQIGHEVQILMDEFLVQNQESIEVVLRVLKLIDHDLENVIHDCERIIDLDSLDSVNVIFSSVTKPLLLKVRDLCDLVAGNRVAEVEAGLEAVQAEAFVYRKNLDAALRDIAIVSSQLETDMFEKRAQQKKKQMLVHLNQMETMLAGELNQNMTNILTKWLELFRNFNAVITDKVSLDLDMHPEIAMLYDLYDFLDNETAVLKEELEEFLVHWVDLVEDILEELTNVTGDVDSFLREYPLERFFNGETRLTCVANYFQNLHPKVSYSLDKFHRCVEYEDEMVKAFRWIDSIPDSVDKAIEYIIETYTSCVKLIVQFEYDLSFKECLQEVPVLVNKTREFMEYKSIEIYSHVLEAMKINDVTIGACFNAQIIDVLLLNSEYLEKLEDCSSN